MWNFPNYHPLVVHFPIVLLIFAAFLQFLARLEKRIEPFSTDFAGLRNCGGMACR